MADKLLLEDGSSGLLLETGGFLLLEGVALTESLTLGASLVITPPAGPPAPPSSGTVGGTLVARYYPVALVRVTYVVGE